MSDPHTIETATESAEAGRVTLSIPADRRFLHLARAATRSGLADLDLPLETMSDLVLVVDELVVNAMEHGAGDHVRLDLSTSDGEVVVLASNETGTGTLAPVDTWTMPGPEETSGRGLGIVRALCSAVEVHHSNGWLTVQGRFAVPTR